MKLCPSTSVNRRNLALAVLLATAGKPFIRIAPFKIKKVGVVSTLLPGLAPKVVEKTKRFVMVRIDQDKEKDKTGKYAPDGGYIPRTMFLAPDGTLAADVHAPRDKFQYFYDENDPASVLTGMDAAIAKFATAKK